MGKEKLNYYDEFVKNMDYALESARILNEYIDNFDSDKSKAKEESVHKLENEADRNLHNLLNCLTRDFVPPFDREDIIEISHNIDDLEDCIDDVVIKVNIFNVTVLRSDVKQFTKLILEGCEKLENLFVLFKNNKKRIEMHDTIIEVNRIEEVGDSLYQNAINELFVNEKDAIEVVKWMNLYNCLEDCLDQAEKVANCVEGITLKLS